MNKVSLTGRLTKDPDIRSTAGEKPMMIARYTLAVDRKFKSQEQTADFINVKAFGKSAEFVEKYIRKGMKIGVTGRIETGSYKNKDGNTVYTFDVIAEDQEFEEKKGTVAEAPKDAPKTDSDGFMSIPDGIDEQLPFL